VVRAIAGHYRCLSEREHRVSEVAEGGVQLVCARFVGERGGFMRVRSEQDGASPPRCSQVFRISDHVNAPRVRDRLAAAVVVAV